MDNRKITEEDKKRLDSLFDGFSIIADETYVFLCDMRYDYSRWSKGLVDSFELPSEYMYGAGDIWEEHIHPEDRQAYHDGVAAIFAGEQQGHDMLYRARRPDGKYDICTCRGIVIKDQDGNPEYFGGSIRNHSEQKHIDSITGLRNQYGFFSDLKSYIKNETPIVIGMAGVGKLAEVNAIYGYGVGNKVLQHFGRYLMDNVTNRGGVYRLDGSRFALISTTQTEAELADLYEVLRAYCRKGIRINNVDIVFELNAGIISLDEFNVDDQTVYSCLNLAYQESKNKRHGDLVPFQKKLAGGNKEEMEILYAIHKSIPKGFGGFYLVYQPVIDAKTEKLVGAEALLRWKNDKYGTVPPDTFIPFLEADPIFPALGEWILTTALEDARRMLNYIPDFTINVNLSYSQIEKDGFTDAVWNILRKTGFSPSQLCLEVTERCRLLDVSLLKNVITRLKSGGVKIALDDFGTGFSSVGLIKTLPFDTIKIDRSFVQEIEGDDQERLLLGNFTDLAGLYGARVCVEGIETAGMKDIIKEYRVNSFQGFYYSKPILIEELLAEAKKGPDCFIK